MQKLNVMDYSLLLGIHYTNRRNVKQQPVVPAGGGEVKVAISNSNGDAIAENVVVQGVEHTDQNTITTSTATTTATPTATTATTTPEVSPSPPTLVTTDQSVTVGSDLFVTTALSSLKVSDADSNLSSFASSNSNSKTTSESSSVPNIVANPIPNNFTNTNTTSSSLDGSVLDEKFAVDGVEQAQPKRRQSNYGLPGDYDNISKPQDINFIAPPFEPLPENPRAFCDRSREETRRSIEG